MHASTMMNGPWPDMRGMTWGRLYENCVDVPSTVAFLRGIGLLATDMQCCNAACNGQQMAERKLACKDGMTWRCLNKDCRRVKNIRTGSLFERSHLNLKQIILLVYFWTRNMLNQELIRHELDIRSSSTIVDWKNFIREVCELYFVLNPVQFDESEDTMEIEESQSGRVCEELCLIDGIYQDTEEESDATNDAAPPLLLCEKRLQSPKTSVMSQLTDSPEVMWRIKFGGGIDAFHHMCDCIRQCFPV